MPGPFSSAAPRSVPGADPDGVLLVDKPAGVTSSDVVVAVRRMFKLKKVGHGGTLDPQATGLLVLLVGRGTKLSSAAMSGDKTYEGVLRLGVATNTQDAGGEVVFRGDPSGVTRETLEALVASDFTGDVFQTPPMVSAIKVDGVPLYKRARKGEEVAREPRLVHVFSFRVDEFGIPDTRFTVRCSKGTYVRTLCHDIGEALGCGAHLAALRRVRSGRFGVADAISLAALRALPRAELPSKLLPLSSLV
ncbi:MAG: tRNA pseudouridine(55) synthase TruB [Kiritimatiellae bacterium]|nr:tRNA pseudouridine(55) synthase TruB [Kiritimatiellia bacterium]